MTPSSSDNLLNSDQKTSPALIPKVGLIKTLEGKLESNLHGSLKGKKILLGITGSIAAFKACDIVRFLRNCGAQVRVVLTPGAENFVTKVTLETLSGYRVLTGFWDASHDGIGTHHIDTARWGDLVLIAPCTANFIAKMAQGMADDLLSTELLAFRGPVLVAPAMNPTMYAHPAVQHNVRLLEERGVTLLGPAKGNTSCGEDGIGRMLEPSEIVEQVAAAFYAPPNNRHLVITLGPTQSAIDPVRFLTNRSSGLMGTALCWAAVQAGYRVTAICGPISDHVQAQLPASVEVIRVQTARQMSDAAIQLWKKDKNSGADVFIATAAVLDWEIQNPATSKLKKDQGPPALELTKSPDVLALVSSSKTDRQFVLGFAAETESPVENALGKLRKKGCDAIFANDVSHSDQGFESAFNSGWWITPTETLQFEKSTKQELARSIISLVLKNT